MQREHPSPWGSQPPLLSLEPDAATISQGPCPKCRGSTPVPEEASPCSSPGLYRSTEPRAMKKSPRCFFTKCKFTWNNKRKPIHEIYPEVFTFLLQSGHIGPLRTFPLRCSSQTEIPGVSVASDILPCIVSSCFRSISPPSPSPLFMSDLSFASHVWLPPVNCRTMEEHGRLEEIHAQKTRSASASLQSSRNTGGWFDRHPVSGDGPRDPGWCSTKNPGRVGFLGIIYY